jgi:hypothetical protein
MYVCRDANRWVGRALFEPDFRVTEEKEFLIISTRRGEGVEASLFVDGKEERKFIAKAVGENHFDAVMVLQDDLAERRRRKR